MTTSRARLLTISITVLIAVGVTAAIQYLKRQQRQDLQAAAKLAKLGDSGLLASIAPAAAKPAKAPPRPENFGFHVAFPKAPRYQAQHTMGFTGHTFSTTSEDGLFLFAMAMASPSKTPLDPKRQLDATVASFLADRKFDKKRVRPWSLASAPGREVVAISRVGAVRLRERCRFLFVKNTLYALLVKEALDAGRRKRAPRIERFFESFKLQPSQPLARKLAPAARPARGL